MYDGQFIKDDKSLVIAADNPVGKFYFNTASSCSYAYMLRPGVGWNNGNLINRLQKLLYTIWWLYDVIEWQGECDDDGIPMKEGIWFDASVNLVKKPQLITS